MVKKRMRLFQQRREPIKDHFHPERFNEAVTEENVVNKMYFCTTKELRCTKVKQIGTYSDCKE